jgi:RNA-directed DNA polymerase
MKRLGYIYPRIYDMQNLKVAHKMARRGKSWYEAVQKVDNNEEFYLKKLQKSLKDKTFKTSKYIDKEINDKGKKRVISKLPYYPDRIVHWAIMLVIEEVFLKNFIFDTYASIPKKGVHLAVERIKEVIKKENVKYCLKLDIKKFFPSIDKEILKEKLKRKFKDPDLLWLLFEIIDSYNKGVPIGNYLSQYLANFYLSDLDHIMKEKLKCKYYYRYMDDIVILHSNKEELRKLFKEIEKIVEKENLEIKKNWQIFPIASRGIDFLGYVFKLDHISLRKRIKTRMKYKIQRIQKKNSIDKSDVSSIMSYSGWLLSCNCKNLRKRLLHPLMGKNIA